MSLAAGVYVYVLMRMNWKKLILRNRLRNRKKIGNGERKKRETSSKDGKERARKEGERKR